MKKSMAVSKLFSKDKNYISGKRIRNNYQNDPAFHEIMRDPVIAKVLDQPGEQKKFHDLLREKARDGKVDIHDMRQIADKLAHGRVAEISGTEGVEIARAFFPDSSRRYEHDASEPEKNPNAPKKSLSSGPNSKIQSVGKTSNVPATYLTYRPKSVDASSDSIGAKNKKTSFFDSMRSVSRNKKS